MRAFRLAVIFSTAVTALVLACVVLGQPATAQAATGSVSGRVVWGQCIRAIPLPAVPSAAQPPDAQVAPPSPALPGSPSGLPAGAVLVAVQNTAVSARTDEAGRFTLSGVPAGQYLTVAAGPVASAVNAIAERPNVLVDGGQAQDIGTLSLGGPMPLGIPCRFPGLASGAPAEPPADPSAMNP